MNKISEEQLNDPQLKENDLILIVEDDIKLAQLFSSFLSKNGFEVHHRENGIDGIQAVKELNPQLIILDVMLPGLDGLSVCRELKEFYRGQIIMLTALSDDIDEVAGLEMGADGYLGKPIKPRVLLAHIRAHLRRDTTPEKIEFKESDSIISAGEVILNASKRTVSVKGYEKELTSAEFDLLWLLAEKKGTVISRDSLHQSIFRIEYDGLDRNIDIRISKLRKKLGDDSKYPELIKTVRSQGYLLAC
jgi:two-component system response regulator RstA